MVELDLKEIFKNIDDMREAGDDKSRSKILQKTSQKAFMSIGGENALGNSFKEQKLTQGNKGLSMSKQEMPLPNSLEN